MKEPLYHDLPDVFTFFDGTRVTAPRDWDRRKEELKTWFSKNVLGDYPAGAEQGFSYTVVSDTVKGAARIKRVVMQKGKYSSEFRLFLPLGVERPPVVIYNILTTYEPKFDLDNVDNYETAPSVTSLPLGYILSNKIAVATYYVNSVAPDNYGGDMQGINAELLPAKTKTSAAGIAAWSFYAKRIADFLVTDGSVDPEKIGIAGHSRGGKTALFTAAFDERFRFAYVSNSGCTGASIARGNTGETLEKINHRFPYWFCENYHEYSGREYEMPVDFHELCALVAPRLLYVTSSSLDDWACPPNEFASCREASRVWTDIYGIKGLEAPEEPELDQAYHGGNVAYHIKTGKHTFDYSDWQKFIAFLKRKLQ